MCGISGIVTSNGNEPKNSELKKMSDIQTHRGPDGEGIWREGSAGFSHRRLSVIDIEGGSQPMLSEDGRYLLVYNGELYNYRELKKNELSNYSYKTSSDTEVILAAWCKWGEDSLEKLNGIFSFAIWDREQKVLALVRDRYGVKPLYYAVSGRRIIFSSELKAILEVAPELRKVDLKNLNELLTYRYSPSPSTLFRGIKKVRPGHLICFADGDCHERRYFGVGKVDGNFTHDELLKKGEELLHSSIKRQLVSDVPIGVLLSGGVDSSLLATIATKEYGSSLTAFTAGFKDGGRVDETDFAKKTAKRLGIKHEVVRLDPKDFMKTLESAVWHTEEPIATTSLLPLFLLCKKIGESHKVVLSGQGVDELFGGYRRHLAEQISQKIRPLFSFAPLKTVASMFIGKSKAERAFYSLGEKNETLRFLKIFSLFNDDMRREILKSPPNNSLTKSIDYYKNDLHGLDNLNRLLHIEMRTSLPDDLLLYTDKVSMASSVEVRLPFLDREFVSFAESLPSKMKINCFKQKVLFKKLAEKELPKEVIQRAKLGFETPTDEWFRKEMQNDLRDFICSSNSITAEFFNKKPIEEMMDAHLNNKQDFSKELFLLLSIELWAKRFEVSI